MKALKTKPPTHTNRTSTTSITATELTFVAPQIQIEILIPNVMPLRPLVCDWAFCPHE